MNSIRVIGIGNAWAGDDTVGIAVTRHLKTQNLKGVDIIEAGLIGLNVLDLMDGAEHVILIDAVQSDQSPGTIHRLEIPGDLQFVMKVSWGSSTASTHSFGLGEALALGNTLGKLPPKLTIYGVELDQVTQGESLSPPVAQTITRVATHIQQDLGTLACMNSN